MGTQALTMVFGNAMVFANAVKCAWQGVVLVLIALSSMPHGMAQQPPPLPAPNIDIGAAGSIFAMARQADGKLVVGGDFSRIAGVARANLARFNTNGSLDLSFDPGADGVVFDLEIDSTGRIYAAGNFLNLSSAARSRLARMDANGGIDPTWSPSADGVVYDLALSNDQSMIYAVGEYATIAGQSRQRVARLSTSPAGSVDLTWRAGSGFSADFSVTDVILDEINGFVYISGYMETVDGAAHRGVARLFITGTGAADSWNPQMGGIGNVFALEQDASHVYLGGPFSSVQGASGTITRLSLTRIEKSTGFADATWNPNLNAGSTVLHLRRSSDGLYVAGKFATVGGVSQNHLARIATTGTGALDLTWRPVAYDPTEFLLLDNNENLYAAEYFEPVSGLTEAGTLAYLSKAAGAANLWPTGIVAENRGLVVTQLALADGSIILGGTFEIINGQVRKNLAKINALGAFDPSFVANTDGGVQSLTLQQGQLVAGGFFSRVNNTARTSIARVNPNTGALDASFVAQINGPVLAVASDAANHVFLTGPFSQVNSTSRLGLARLESNGSLSVGWDNPINSLGIALAAQGDGTLYVAGNFTSVALTPRNRFARIGANGLLDPTFVVDADDVVNAIALVNGGDVLIGGRFLNVNGQGRSRIAKLDSTGQLRSFNPAADGAVYSILPLPDNSVVVGGDFTQLGGVARLRMGRVNGNTGAINPWFAPQADQPVLNLAHLPLNNVISSAGAFTFTGGVPRMGLAWFGAADAAASQVVPTLTALHVLALLVCLGISGLWILRGRGDA